MSRCLYNSDFATFLDTDSASIYRILDDNYHGEALTTTRDAWKAEIDIMKNVVSSLNNADGQIIFEYDIPRLGKRIDVVLLYRGIVFCLEFKVGESKILESNIDQVLDYALDLKNFHKFSEDKVIAPILIATNYSNRSTAIQMSVYDDKVINPLVTGETGIFALIHNVVSEFPNEVHVHKDWVISPYAPTPTIVEAAKTLYESHSVENITRHEADKASTDATIKYILDVIQKSKANGEKSICFVTGVPGAGKTLVGLDVAVKQTYQGSDKPVEDEGAVYLSGNGPLVAVLTEALAKDNYQKCRAYFIESRFNNWCVGELYIISNDLIPNARRDGFENNRIFNEFCDNFKKTIGVELGSKIRAASKARNNPMKKALTKTEKTIAEAERVLETGFNSTFEKEQIVRTLEGARKDLYVIPKDAPVEVISQKTELMDRLSTLTTEVGESSNYRAKKDISSDFSKAEKKIIQAMLEVLTRNFERATVDSLYKEFLQELKKKG